MPATTLRSPPCATFRSQPGARCASSPRRRWDGIAEMDCAVVLFTRDLRVHDHPALSGALDTADCVVPLFVLDSTLTAQSANRTAYLLDGLRDLGSKLHDRGGALVIARGDPVVETMRIADQNGTSRGLRVRRRDAVRPTARGAPGRGVRDAATRAAPVSGRHRRPVRAPAAGRERSLPRLHAVLEGVAPRAASWSARGTATRPGAGGTGIRCDPGTS